MWIPVAERVPDAELGEEGKAPTVSCDVLVYFPDAGENTHDIANYDHELKRWALVTHGFSEPDTEPTYWMSLPQSPGVGKCI